MYHKSIDIVCPTSNFCHISIHCSRDIAALASKAPNLKGPILDNYFWLKGGSYSRLPKLSCDGGLPHNLGCKASHPLKRNLAEVMTRTRRVIIHHIKGDLTAAPIRLNQIQTQSKDKTEMYSRKNNKYQPLKCVSGYMWEFELKGQHLRIKKKDKSKHYSKLVELEVAKQ